MYFKSETWGAPGSYADPNSYPETFYTKKLKKVTPKMNVGTNSFKKLPEGGKIGNDPWFHYEYNEKKIRETSPPPV